MESDVKGTRKMKLPKTRKWQPLDVEINLTPSDKARNFGMNRSRRRAGRNADREDLQHSATEKRNEASQSLNYSDATLSTVVATDVDWHILNEAQDSKHVDDDKTRINEQPLKANLSGREKPTCTPVPSAVSRRHNRPTHLVAKEKQSSVPQYKPFGVASARKLKEKAKAEDSHAISNAAKTFDATTFPVLGNSGTPDDGRDLHPTETGQVPLAQRASQNGKEYTRKRTEDWLETQATGTITSNGPGTQAAVHKPTGMASRGYSESNLDMIVPDSLLEEMRNWFASAVENSQDVGMDLPSFGDQLGMNGQKWFPGVKSLLDIEVVPTPRAVSLALGFVSPKLQPSLNQKAYKRQSDGYPNVGPSGEGTQLGNSDDATMVEPVCDENKIGDGRNQGDEASDVDGDQGCDDELDEMYEQLDPFCIEPLVSTCPRKLHNPFVGGRFAKQLAINRRLQSKIHEDLPGTQSYSNRLLPSSMLCTFCNCLIFSLLTKLKNRGIFKKLMRCRLNKEAEKADLS